MAEFLSSKSRNHLRQDVAEGAAILSHFFAEANFWWIDLAFRFLSVIRSFTFIFIITCRSVESGVILHWVGHGVESRKSRLVLGNTIRSLLAGYRRQVYHLWNQVTINRYPSGQEPHISCNTACVALE